MLTLVPLLVLLLDQRPHLRDSRPLLLPQLHSATNYVSLYDLIQGSPTGNDKTEVFNQYYKEK